MKKFLSYFIVFVLGFVVCAWVFYHFFGAPGAAGPQVAGSAPRGGIHIARTGPNEIRDSAKVVGEYVVNIDTVGKPIRQFGFGGFFGFQFGQPQEVIPRGQASGVIFSSDGYILTNNHVVRGATKLTVTLPSGKQYTAKLIGRDPRTDIAVIKIDAMGLPFARFADSNTLQVGDWVVAVGNALGLGPTVTVGVVSAKRSHFDIDGKVFEGVIQTDAAINRGNSGGALADLNGNLVGINTAIASTSPGGGNIGIGFAIPSNTARKIADQLVKHGSIVRPYLGIQYAPFNLEVRKVLEQAGVRNLPSRDGALIREVYQNSPAAAAGLQPQDIVLKVNGKPVSVTAKPERGKTTIADEVGMAKVGDRLLLEVWHAATGRIGTIGVRVGEMPPDFGEQPQQPQGPPEGGGFPFP